MREIRLSGLMSGDGKRSVLLGAQPPRSSSTLLKRLGDARPSFHRAGYRILPGVSLLKAATSLTRCINYFCLA